MSAPSRGSAMAPPIPPKKTPVPLQRMSPQPQPQPQPQQQQQQQYYLQPQPQSEVRYGTPSNQQIAGTHNSPKPPPSAISLAPVSTPAHSQPSSINKQLLDSKLDSGAPGPAAQLWTEMGLDFNGKHNYDPSTVALSASEMQCLSDEFVAHRRLFGFQVDNVRNQMEHLCFLMQNAKDRYGDAAVQYLHNRFFSNYRRWCAHVNAQRWCFQKRMRHSFDHPTYGDRNKIQDLVLWLLIWGEAANLRHCPEFLAFVFYRMSNQRQEVIDSGSLNNDHSNDEWYRRHVIEPAYNIVFGMQQYMRRNGSLKDHPKRPNYDDVNEFFWRRAWLDNKRSYHDEDADRFWGNAYTQKGRLIELDEKTKKVIVQKEGANNAENNRKDNARNKLKTFPEKRSWLNLYRSFYRIVELHAFALHILILIAYDFIPNKDWKNIFTCAITPAGLTFILELVEIGFYWGVIWAQGLFISFVIRLVVYAAVLLILLYLYLFEGGALWQTVAIAYLAARALWEFINISTHRWIRKWHLSEDRNFESNVATSDSFFQRCASTLFWIVIFGTKCVYSYYTYIEPMVTLTHTLLNIPGWVGQAGIGPDNNSSLSNWLLVVLLWTPTLIMFAIDTQIFFSISIVFIGIVLGVRDRVCNIRSWNQVEKGFNESWRNGSKKFFGSQIANQIQRIEVDKFPSSGPAAAGATINATFEKGPLNLPALISPPWHLINVMWKEIVDEMRASDHISYHDQELLQFGHFTFVNLTELHQNAAQHQPGAQNATPEVRETFFLPPFVTAGQIGSFIDMLGELQEARERRAGGMGMILQAIKDNLRDNETMRTALDEAYTAGSLLLQTFLLPNPQTPGVDMSNIGKISPATLKALDFTGGNKLLEYTCRQKRPHAFLKDVMKCLENTCNEAIALCFDRGHQTVIRKAPTLASIAAAQEETIRLEEAEANGINPYLSLEKIPTKVFEGHLNQLYKYWVQIAEGCGIGLGADKPANSGADAEAPKVQLHVIDNLSANQLPSLLRTLYHLLSTANVDARPANSSVNDRLMFFLSSLNTRMPDRQNSIQQMYSWTVLTPYVEELVIYTPEELELPNAEGVTADFYLKTTHRKEWLFFLERLAADPLGGDPAYRLVQKREWCSFRGQTLLRTVRGMMHYERALKILTLLELARGGHWTSVQEKTAKQIAQRKFQYVLSCQKYGAFKSARERRDRGELADKANLPDSVRVERKKLLDEAQKADDIEYILRKYPHLRVAYVDDQTVPGEGKVFASVLVKAVVRPEDDGSALPAHLVLGGKPPASAKSAGGYSKESNEDGSNRSFESRPFEGRGISDHTRLLQMDPYEVDADKNGGSWSARALKSEQSSTLVSRGSDSSDIQEIYRVRLPGTILIGEGKPENQNHAMIFTRGEMLEAIDMNQDNYLEEAFKMRNLLEEFDPLRAPDNEAHPRDEIQRPNPVDKHRVNSDSKAAKSGILKCGILGFRENIFTANLMSAGTYMSLMEATFVSITLRTFAWLSTRMHYGHPDLLDKVFFATRGGMSKSSKMLHVSEDIFAGFKSTLRGGRILHKEYTQVGKGRDLGFNQLFLFEAKLASGAGEQALSREAYRLGHYLDLPRLLSFFYGSIGFYTTTALIVYSIATLLFAKMMVALTGVDKRVTEYNENYGVSVGLLQASSAYQLGLLLIFPMLAEIALEKTFMKALSTLIWLVLTGAPFFFFFHTQTKAFFFNNSVMFGGAKYRATGRGFVLSRDSFTRIYRTYARTHIYPAMKFLFMMVVYGIFNRSGINWFVDMWAPLLLVIAWLYAPMWFNPMAFDHDRVIGDFKEWRAWLDRKSSNEENSWQGWWIMETEYVHRTPRSTKFWFTLYNLVIPVVIMAAAISALEASSFSRVYFLLISVGVSIGLVVVSLFFVYQCHPVGDTYRWLKFILGVLIVALFVVTIIFDTGSTSFGWKGTNFVVYLIVIALTFNSICKILMLHGAGPYRFGFCLTWFRYVDTIFGLIMYFPLLVFSFVGLASVQTRLLYNRAFFKGLKISELLRGDPARREQFRDRTVQQIQQQQHQQQNQLQQITSNKNDNDNNQPPSNNLAPPRGRSNVNYPLEVVPEDSRYADVVPRSGMTLIFRDRPHNQPKRRQMITGERQVTTPVFVPDPVVEEVPHVPSVVIHPPAPNPAVDALSYPSPSLSTTHTAIAPGPAFRPQPLNVITPMSQIKPQPSNSRNETDSNATNDSNEQEEKVSQPQPRYTYS